MTLVGAMASLLAVIAPSEAQELPGLHEDCLREHRKTTMTGMVSLDYWVIIPFLLVAAVMLITRVREYLGEVKMAGGTIFLPMRSSKGVEARARVWRKLSTNNAQQVGGKMQPWSGHSCCTAGECAAEAGIFTVQQRLAITGSLHSVRTQE
jgi:hypothetical protein